MLKKFRTYQLAVELYRRVKKVRLPYYMRDQLLRASSSVCLNLAEGSAKPTKRDRRRFYAIALASLREIQAIVELESDRMSQFEDITDHLGACLYRLMTN